MPHAGSRVPSDSSSDLVRGSGARQVEGEPAVSVEDLRAMFIHKRLPRGWETWRKTRLDWVTNSAALAVSAAREYHRLRTRD